MIHNFKLRQYSKMVMQHIVLPCIYKIYCLKKIDKKLIVFADAHHNEIPYSMKLLFQEVSKKDYTVVEHYYDYQKLSLVKLLKYINQFMQLYATAKYVVICDNFLPISSCKKREGTRVIQLWHGAGILKKFAYDTNEDIPQYYRGHMYANYDLVTVSSSCCVKVYEDAMRLNKGIVVPTGISRTDNFFDNDFLNECKQQFIKKYPDAKNKKIILWAPTFRGNAAFPHIVGKEIVDELESTLGKEYLIITKAHPHIDNWGIVSNCDIASERLLPVVDILITDYSTIIFEFMLLKKPIILFVPDYYNFIKERGFYIDFKSIPGLWAETKEELIAAIKGVRNSSDDYKKFIGRYMEACDGNSTKRILDYIENS